MNTSLTAFTVSAAALAALLVAGCASTPETIDLGPKTVTYSEEELMKRPTITLPPGYNTDNFRKIRMNVFFESIDGREKVIDSDGKFA